MLKSFNLKIFSLSFLLFGSLLFAKTRDQNYNTLEKKDFFISSKNYSKNLIDEQSKSLYWTKSEYKKTLFKQKKPLELEDITKFFLKNTNIDIYQTISDYTYRISTPTGTGTGWILDFEIPENSNSYPLTWFIATNMHVISSLKFSDDKYNISLPKKNNVETSEIELLKTSIDIDKTVLVKKKKLSEISDIEKIQNLPNSAIIGNDVFTIIKNESKPIVEKIKKPELFYHALNFAGPRYNEDDSIIKNSDYLKDFAVLKITFENSEKAKKITNNFYNNYFVNKDKANNKKKLINLFPEELIYDPKIKLKDLYENKTFFTGGYSLGEDFFTTNFAHNKKTDTPVKNKLFHSFLNKQYGSWLKNNHKQIIPGHLIPEKIFQMEWNKTPITNWGYIYVLDNSFTYWGASGSMCIDEKQNLIGILFGGDIKQNIDFIAPLKSEGIFQERKIISPKYDLIRGTGEHNKSYKSQLEKYFPNMNTFLKSINWGLKKENIKNKK